MAYGPGGPNDINRMLRMQQAADARKREQRRQQDRVKRGEKEALEEVVRPEGHGRLLMGKEQGVHRYFLAGKRLQSGREIEFYVDEKVGWVRGKFYWAQKARSPGTIRVPMFDPDIDLQTGEPESVGVMEISLPKNGVCRWPEEE